MAVKIDLPVYFDKTMFNQLMISTKARGGIPSVMTKVLNALFIDGFSLTMRNANIVNNNNVISNWLSPKVEIGTELHEILLRMKSVDSERYEVKTIASLKLDELVSAGIIKGFNVNFKDNVLDISIQTDIKEKDNKDEIVFFQRDVETVKVRVKVE